jgi:hypothetical protein
VTESEATFPTFCHISEYGEAGYRNLHRMLAFSAPLNLWAPSSVLVRNASHVEPKRFVGYVEKGLIRIHGREDWLTSQEFRDRQLWPNAAWDREIDDALDAIRRDDQHEPQQARRVVVAPPEEGKGLAIEYLERFPAQIDRWNRIFNSSTAPFKLPIGTREKADRQRAKGPLAVAIAILRDAYNHGHAIRSCGAEAPLFLSSADRQFLKLLEDSWAPRTFGMKPTQQPSLSAELGGQMVEVLRHLDYRGKQNLDRFLKGRGHRLLVSWLSDICKRYRYANPRTVDGLVIMELSAQLAGATFTRPLQNVLAQPIISTAGLVGLVLTATAFVQEPTNAIATTGMAVSIVQVAGGVAKQFGIAPSSYDGPQWPFLYAYRRRAQPRQVENLRHVLADLRSE